MRYRLSVLLFFLLINLSQAVTILFLPFEDKVKLKDTWDLSVDIPRWYSNTVDTIGENDSTIKCMNFDTLLTALERSNLKRADYLAPEGITRLGGMHDADYVITGKVTQFKVMKQALNSDAPLSISHELNKSTHGQGGLTVMGGLQSYTAEIVMDIDIYGVNDGQLIKELEFNSSEKDAGFKMWLSFQQDNPELNFHYMGRSPFGSVYFQKNIAGATMNYFSNKLKTELLKISAVPQPAVKKVSKEYLEGKIIERSGNDIYLDLGSHEKLMQGELFEVLKPDRAVKNEQGDTLGWIEKPVGTIKIRFVKAKHFSQASIVDETDSLKVGWTVRPKIGRVKD